MPLFTGLWSAPAAALACSITSDYSKTWAVVLILEQLVSRLLSHTSVHNLWICFSSEWDILPTCSWMKPARPQSQSPWSRWVLCLREMDRSAQTHWLHAHLNGLVQCFCSVCRRVRTGYRRSFSRAMFRVWIPKKLSFFIYWYRLFLSHTLRSCWPVTPVSWVQLWSPSWRLPLASGCLCWKGWWLTRCTPDMTGDTTLSWLVNCKPFLTLISSWHLMTYIVCLCVHEYHC